MARILIVDDEDAIRLSLAEALKGAHTVEEAADGEAALVKLRRGAFDLVLTDLRMGTASGMEVLRAAKEGASPTAVILLTAYGSIDGAVEAMKAGADDYLTKPFRLEELERRVAKALEKGRLEVERDYYKSQSSPEPELVGQNPAWLEVLRLVGQAGPSNANVLILGETGAGKEGVARALHEASARRAKPFVAVNCSAFAPSLLESELFGHEKGSFTGAVAARKGRLELADQGTLFLDEVGDLPADAQVKLLRAIELKTFERVGGNASLKSDFRVLAATHRDLGALVKEGRFREDLYFRLAVFPLRVPPLRERGDDVLLLASHFLARKAAGRKLAFSAVQEAQLMAHAWPGNVRELQNAVERAVLLEEGGKLALDLAAAPAASAPAAGAGLAGRLEEEEKRAIQEAMRLEEGNQSRAARRLGLERTTLQYKLKKYGLT